MDLLIRFFGLLLKIFAFIISPIISLYTWIKYRPIVIPAITNDLLRIPAVDLATKIRNREVTAVAVVQAYIQRVKLINPLINAVVEDRFLGALVEADRADKLVQQLTQVQLMQEYPLLGVPFTVKESVGMKGELWAVAATYTTIPHHYHTSFYQFELYILFWILLSHGNGIVWFWM